MFKLLKNILVNVLIYWIILYVVHTYSAGIFWDWAWFFVESTQYTVILTFFVLALIFWFINNVVKFVFKVLTLPLKYITFWLFSLVLNMLMIYVFEYALSSYDFGIVIYLGSFLQVFVFSLAISISYILIKKII